MKILFRIEYKTRWGENLFLRSAGFEYAMAYTQGGIWTVEVDSGEFLGGRSSIEYYYEVRTGDLSTRH